MTPPRVRGIWPDLQNAMQVTVEKLSPVLLEVEIQIPADRVRTEVDKAYGVLQRTARVKGYRPGKAPKQVLAYLYAGRIHADRVIASLTSSDDEGGTRTRALAPSKRSA